MEMYVPVLSYVAKFVLEWEVCQTYEGWNFNSVNYVFTADTK